MNYIYCNLFYLFILIFEIHCSNKTQIHPTGCEKKSSKYVCCLFYVQLKRLRPETHMIETETWYQQSRSEKSEHLPPARARCNDIIIVTNNTLTAEA